MNISLRARVIVATAAAAGAFSILAHALILQQASDLISTSIPSTGASHIITFVVAQAVPASGSITLTPESWSFPSYLLYTDVDIETATSSGNYSQRDLAAAADATNDGFTLTGGGSGITITLNSTTGIAANDRVRVTIGTAATYGQAGAHNVINPAVSKSYRLYIKTYDSGATLLDNSVAMFAIVNPVGITARAPPQPPILSGGRPFGTVAANNTNIEISLNTNTYSSCRYATSSGIAYSSMTNSFSQTHSIIFYTNLSGFQNNTTYTYYVRCYADFGLPNPSDYIISFTLDPTPISNTSIVSGSTVPGRGGTGPFHNGSSVLYLSSVALAGYAPPQSLVTILTDGVESAQTTAASDGSFRASVGGLERGTYSFQVFATDSTNVTSASYSSTLTIGQGTDNTISGILVPPTALLASDSVSLGQDAVIAGQAPYPGSVQFTVQFQSKTPSPSDLRTYSASTTPAGTWEIDIPARDLKLGDYILRGQYIRSASLISAYSKLLFLGVGKSASADYSSRADINHDGKVNLIDFSIMLTHWGTEDADSDINQDGIVNLADFSILLFNWTG